jgi:hypothetical protein
MKNTLLAAAALIATAAGTSSAFAADVGVSISVNQPGLYGRIDINQPPPPPVALVYAQPVVIEPSPVAVVRRPIYLHVPAGYERNWGRYCAQYAACGQPVYFVQDHYYREHYYRPPVVVHERPVVIHEEHGHGHAYGHDKDKHDHDHDHDHDDHGKGHGHGHDNDR